MGKMMNIFNTLLFRVTLVVIIGASLVDAQNKNSEPKGIVGRCRTFDHYANSHSWALILVVKLMVLL